MKTVCKNDVDALMRVKHAIISRNRQQNMAIIGFKLEEVLLLQNKKRSLTFPMGVPRPMGVPSRYV